MLYLTERWFGSLLVVLMGWGMWPSPPQSALPFHMPLGDHVRPLLLFWAHCNVRVSGDSGSGVAATLSSKRPQLKVLQFYFSFFANSFNSISMECQKQLCIMLLLWLVFEQDNCLLLFPVCVPEFFPLSPLCQCCCQNHKFYLKTSMFYVKIEVFEKRKKLYLK